MNATEPTLPELTDERIDQIEASLFTQIARERGDAVAQAERRRVRAVRRERVWMGAAAAAAVVAVAAVIAPQLGALTGGSSGSSVGQSAMLPAEVAPMAAVPDGNTEAGAADGAFRDASGTPVTTGRDIIATASATVLVTDSEAAADAVAAAAAGAGGYVESMSLGDASSTSVDASTYPDYPVPSGAWIVVRVPADQLTSTLAGLSELGEVTSTQIDRRDVTTEAVDLRARVASLEASVARLTELMGQSATTADLIAAESALSQRQSELDSLRQQLTSLDTQVSMSTLTVSLTSPQPVVSADPAGFGDGIGAGWNGLVATLNGLVIGIGFLLPWLGVLAVVGAIVWVVRRVLKRRRTARQVAAGPRD